jgi:hypothetical protein
MIAAAPFDEVRADPDLLIAELYPGHDSAMTSPPDRG